MDSDCIELILEHFKFIDLLSIAQTNKKLSSIAGYVVKRKYSDYKMQLMCPKPDEKQNILDGITNTLNQIGFKIGKEAIEVDGRNILLRTHEAIEKTIKYLGVYNIELHSEYYNPKGIALIGNLINQYASETLEAITFYKTEYVLKNITKALVNVKYVGFDATFDLKESEFSFNSTFPSMQTF